MISFFQKLHYFALYSLLALVFYLGSVLRVVPFYRNLVSRVIDRVMGVKIPSDDYWEAMFSGEMFQGLWRFILLDLNKKTKVGAKAYNSPLVSLDGKFYFRLLEKAKQDRPLVVNFGSSS